MRPGLLGAHHRQVAGLVAELLVLLEGGVVLLVDDEEPEVLTGAKTAERTPTAMPHRARAKTLPVEEPLAVT